jgi:diguanylate cyclase (GGDEF)-like protein
MKRKILAALAVVFACSLAGAVLALLYTGRAAEEMDRVQQVHRIAQLRQHLIHDVQEAQAGLLGAGDGVAPEPGALGERLVPLKQSAAGCMDCHHAPETTRRLVALQALVADYEAALLRYEAVAPAPARAAPLRRDALAVAWTLLRATDKMALDAETTAEARVGAAHRDLGRARLAFWGAILLTLAGALVAQAYLSSALVRPLQALLRGARSLGAGDPGPRVQARDGDELGELAGHLEAARLALRDGAARLDAELQQRKRAEARLLYDAFHDPVTALPNRTLFLDRLQQVIDAGRRGASERYAVLSLKVDGVGAVNQAHGRLVADLLLVAVAERVAQSVRPGDTVACLGGDAFGVLLDRVGGRLEAVVVAERVRDALARPVDVDGRRVSLVASLGAALSSARYQRPEQVLRDAGVAMSRARECGGARVEVFDAAAHPGGLERLRLESELLRALERDEFLLYYQPVVAVRTGKVIAVEALLRWAHPVRGLLSAPEFMDVAEESGAAVPIFDWALAAACAQLRAWHERVPALAGVTLAVNIADAQFLRPDLVDDVQRMLCKVGVDPWFLALEANESALVHDLEASAEKLAELRKLGVQVHLDRFDGNPSSLGILHRLPVHAVKIDAALVAGLPDRAECEEGVKAIVSIAESLDFDVIAEGVDDEVRARRVEALRCRYVQGRHFCEPLPAPRLEARLGVWLAVPARTTG